MTDLPRMTTDRGIEIQARRKVYRGGRPKTLKACVYCGQKFGARELRAHRPKCPLRKRRLDKGRPWNF